jgi:hypothetical protein
MIRQSRPRRELNFRSLHSKSPRSKQGSKQAMIVSGQRSSLRLGEKDRLMQAATGPNLNLILSLPLCVCGLQLASNDA